MGRDRRGSPSRESDRDRDRDRSKRRQDRQGGDRRGSGRRRTDPLEEFFLTRPSGSGANGHDDRNQRNYSPPTINKVETRRSVKQEASYLDEDFNNVAGSSRKVFVKQEVKCQPFNSSSDSRRVFYRENSEDVNNKEAAAINDDLSNLIQTCGKTLSKLDLELHELSVKHQGKPELIDKLEERMEERKKLKKKIKKLKGKAKDNYKFVDWSRKKSKEVLHNLENRPTIKPSFIVDNIFKSIDDTNEYFGKFGTLSTCENILVDNKVKVEYFYREDAFKALKSKHAKGIYFYLDPFPEYSSSKPKAKPVPKIEIKKEIKKEHYGTDRRSKEDFTASLHSSSFESKEHPEFSFADIKSAIPKIKGERMKISPDDFQSNHEDLYSILVINKNKFFKTEKEIYDYFTNFGDIRSIKYEERSSSSQDVLIYFEAGHSLLLAVNSAHHNDVIVKVSDECSVANKDPNISTVSKDDDCREDKRQIVKRRHDDDDDMRDDDYDHVRESRKRRSYDHKNDRKNINHEPTKMKRLSDHHNRDFSLEQTDSRRPLKHARLPDGHNRREHWFCTRCNVENTPATIFHCYKCNVIRPGNWECFDCNFINTPDKLVCYRRNCRKLRPGNWICPERRCREPNWSRSLQCIRDGCEEYQPGSWWCSQEGCNALNFNWKTWCYKCKTDRGQKQDFDNRKPDTKAFEINAEREKHREAMEKLNNEQQQDYSEPSGSGLNHQGKHRRHMTSLRHDFEQPFGSGHNLKENPQHQTSTRQNYQEPSGFGFDHLDKGQNCKSARQDRHEAAKNHERSTDTGWSEKFNRMRQEQAEVIAGNTAKTRQIQSRLLALVENPDGDNCVDLASDEEEHEPQVRRLPPPPPNLRADNPNCVPLGSRPKAKSKIEMRKEVVGIMDDAVIDKIQNGSEKEQEEILRQFNIVRIEQSAKNVVEVDLVDDSDDSDDDLGKYSDGGSIHIENCDMDAEDIIDDVGTHTRPNVTESNEKSDQDLINEIVRGDLESVRSIRLPIRPSHSAAPADDESDDDIVILDG